MASKQPRDRAEARSLCADLFDDDGPSALEPERKHGGGHDTDHDHADRKTRQLCAQVMRALQHVICPMHDPLLEMVRIESVTPNPGPRRLRVSVSVPQPHDVSPNAVLVRLNNRRGWLRTEVAAAIHRKRAPELVFEIVLRMEGGAP